MLEALAKIIEFLSDWLAALVATPVGVLVVTALVGLLLCVGAITSIRWTGRQIRRLTRPRSRLMRRFPGVPSSPPGRASSPHGPASPDAHAAEASAHHVPLRPGPGPRDW